MVFTSQGKLELVVKDIVHPFGIAVGKDNVLFVASNTTGEIYKVTNNQKSLLTTIPGSVSYIAYSQKTDKVYAGCYSCHKIFSVTNKGEVAVIAGTGEAGYKDGSSRDAQFDGPNSIVLLKGDLYVSEFKHNRIRKIEHVE
jgi:sugar lactone lactonase YvrE